MGGLRLRFCGRSVGGIEEPFASFARRRGGRVDATYELENAEPLAHRATSVADGGIWRLYDHAGGWRIEFFAPPLQGEHPVLQADLSRDWASGRIRLDPQRCPPAARAAPFATPFGELLLMGRLAQPASRGLYVHAAAACWPDGADLFLGRSGAGKTTISGIAQRHGAEVLSDDRVVLRFRGGRLWAYGTPFHGLGRSWSVRAAPVRSLVFLEHARESRVAPLSTREAAARLGAVTFATFWSRSALEETLRRVSAAVSLVPVHTLRFRPDASAVEALEQAHAGR